MDNIVDYLVAIFFIVSFLISIFKKKKKATASHSEDNPLNAANKSASNTKKKASNSIEDFMKSVSAEIKKAKEEVNRSEVDEYYEQALLNSDENYVEDENNHEQSEFIGPMPQEKIQESKASNNTNSYSDSLKQTQEGHENKKAKSIRKMLMQENYIKNFIVINEILGKPKSLQK